MSPQYQQMYQERQKALEDIYAPQIQGLQQQITTLPQQYEAQKSALQQAKENAFRDITKTAARGGMYFTGFTPREQARYLGTTYLPGLQQLSQQELAARQGLLGQIATVQGAQRAAGLSYLDQLAAWQRADEQAKAAAKAAASAGFSLGDLGLGTTDTTTPTAVTTPRGTVQKSQQTILNEGIATNYGKLMQSKNIANIRNEFNFLVKQMTNPNVPPQIKQTINNQYQIFLAMAKEYNINLSQLAPSRAEQAVTAYRQKVLPITPLGLATKIGQKEAQLGGKAYNWLFGAR